MTDTNRYVIYDFETLPNLFTACFEDFFTKKKVHFVIHESRNDFVPMMRFMKSLHLKGYWFVGYNCLQFDAQIIEYLIENYAKFRLLPANKLVAKIKVLSQKIIDLPQEEKFDNLIPEWNLTIPHIDVYKQCHFDGKAKRTSLKWLQFTMRFDNIESMPIHHDELVDEEDIDMVLGYNYNDTGSTKEFFKRKKYETDLRATLTKEYGRNLMNASEPRMAREIFGKLLAADMRIDYKELKEKRTYRKRIITKPLIFPYVKFNDPILKKAKSFYETLSFNPYDVKHDNSLGQKKVEKIFKYHNIDNMTIGLGGLHGCIKPGVYKASNYWMIRDIDVTSYYPNLGIENNLFPEHLSSTFCVTYKMLFEMRKKIPKASPINYIFKIILNSTYGLSKEVNNFFHDPKYTYTITINGQLLLLMLGEMMKEAVPDIVFYQFNTDGISAGFDPKHNEKITKVMKQWEKITKLQLEDNFYKQMVIVDVNNYLAEDLKGKIKRKGLFGYSMNPEDKEMDYHKNPSALVIPKALEAYFVHNVPYTDYILSQKDIFDFCCGLKIKRDFELWKYWINLEAGKLMKKRIKEQVFRYYVSKEQTSYKKKYRDDHPKNPGQVNELEKGWCITAYNNHKVKPMKDYKIDYDYYIEGTRKVVAIIENHGGQIKMF